MSVYACEALCCASSIVVCRCWESLLHCGVLWNELNYCCAKKTEQRRVVAQQIAFPPSNNTDSCPAVVQYYVRHNAVIISPPTRLPPPLTTIETDNKDGLPTYDEVIAQENRLYRGNNKIITINTI